MEDDAIVRRLAGTALLPLALLLIAGSVKAADVPFETIAQGVSSEYQQQATLIVQDNETWNALWTNLTAMSNPPGAPQPPDFSTQMAVAAMMGPQPTCRNTIEISNITLENGVLHVNVTKIYGKDVELPCPTEVSPYHIVRLERFDGPISIETTTQNIPEPDPTSLTPLIVAVVLASTATVAVHLIRRVRHRVSE